MRNFFIIIFTLTLFAACKQSNNHSIKLRWIKSHKAENLDTFKIAFGYSMSFLGANFSKEDFNNALNFIDESKFDFDYDKIGFSKDAVDAIKVICDSLKNTEEYKHYGAIDAARFVVLTLHTSPHYYKITGAEPTLTGFSSNHSIEDTVWFAVTNSSVAKGERVVIYDKKLNIGSRTFVAFEGDSVFKNRLAKAKLYETMTLMANNQFAFAVYNDKGNLIHSSPKVFGAAGKPSKCLWCHETSMQTIHNDNVAIGGYLHPDSFKINMISYQKKIDISRSLAKNNFIDFSKLQDHALSEIMYISFMEPSVYRLALEWNLSEAEVLQKLSKLKTHAHEEFPFLGNLYNRNDIDSISEVKFAKVPLSVREELGEEPNFFKK